MLSGCGECVHRLELRSLWIGLANTSASGVPIFGSVARQDTTGVYIDSSLDATGTGRPFTKSNPTSAVPIRTKLIIKWLVGQFDFRLVPVHKRMFFNVMKA
jgi:hypothetical protein